MTAPSMEELLALQLDHARTNTRWVLEGLDDDEYWWEPATPCWSVRHRQSARAGWGAGDWICEDQWPPPEPVPVTTIGWRITHLAAWIDVYRDWTFGSASAHLMDFDVPADAAGGLAWLYTAQDRFLDQVAALGPGDSLALRPVHYGAHFPIVHLVTAILTEQVHHAAEVGVLRDLHRGTARRQPPPPPITGPAWWTGVVAGS